MANLVRHLSDHDLIDALDGLAEKHRDLVARMVEHLAEVERRKLHLELGYSSLHTYATGRLQLSEHEAYLRITAARAARKDANVVSGLESGSLSLSTIKAVAPHLDRHPELLERACGRSKREALRTVAEITGRRATGQPRLAVRALAEGQVELTCIVSEETAQLLEEALDASMHENPARDPERVLAQALQLLIAKKNMPRGRVPAKSERALSAPKRCAFVGLDGHVCGETAYLQIDHIQPKAAGGSDDPANLRWLCGSHNRHEAERQLGTDRVQSQRLRSEVERDLKRALTSLGFKPSEAAPAARRAAWRSLELEPALRLALEGLATPTPARVGAR